MIRGKLDGIVEAVDEATLLSPAVELALTILETCDRAVSVFVAVGVKLCTEENDVDEAITASELGEAWLVGEA